LFAVRGAAAFPAGAGYFLFRLQHTIQGQRIVRENRRESNAEAALRRMI
jgi:hypothetical protein